MTRIDLKKIRKIVKMINYDVPNSIDSLHAPQFSSTYDNFFQQLEIEEIRLPLLNTDSKMIMPKVNVVS